MCGSLMAPLVLLFRFHERVHEMGDGVRFRFCEKAGMIGDRFFFIPSQCIIKLFELSVK